MRRDKSLPEDYGIIFFPRVTGVGSEDLERWEALLTEKRNTENATLHKYSPAIAKLLNPDQPDIAAASLFYQISLLQKNPCPKPWGISGRYALRSLQKLSLDCPYLSKPGVAKAIQRMRTKFRDKFFVNRDFVRLAYSIGEDLMKLQKEDVLVSFNPSDAVLHGNIRTAVLLHHLRIAMNQSDDWIRDEEGNRYVRMSPSIFSREFGYSDDTIARSMRELCQNKRILSRHPEQSMWYTFTSMKGDVALSLYKLL